MSRVISAVVLNRDNDWTTKESSFDFRHGNISVFPAFCPDRLASCLPDTETRTAGFINHLRAVLQGTRSYGATYDWGLKTSSSCYTKITLSFAYGRYSLCCRVLAHKARRMIEDSRQVRLVIQNLLCHFLKVDTVSAAGYSHIRRGVWLRTQDKFVLLYKSYSLVCLR